MSTFRAWLLALLVCPLTAIAVDKYEVDVDFERVIPAMPGGSDGKIQVVEMFWYGCPHCFDFEPYLEGWLKHQAVDVEFVRIPALFNREVWRLHAAAFYTAEVLGVLDQIHKPLFDAIHLQKRKLNDVAALREFFAEHGVEGDTLDRTIDSFAVQAKVRRSADLSRRYGITGTPSVIVNGKYRVVAGKSKSFNNMMRIVDYLVDLERKGEDASLN